MKRVRRRFKRTPPCPRCGAKKTVPIVYGLPSPELVDAADRGEVAIGGCVMDISNQVWACRLCEHRW